MCSNNHTGLIDEDRVSAAADIDGNPPLQDSKVEETDKVSVDMPLFCKKRGFFLYPPWIAHLGVCLCVYV